MVGHKSFVELLTPKQRERLEYLTRKLCEDTDKLLADHVPRAERRNPGTQTV